jgi:segregation and condensation protein A
MKVSSLPPVGWQTFDGPLDLLLAEVRRQNIAIEKIALAPLVARYLDYMRSASARKINLDIEWLHLAATLIQWKSRLLLTRPAAEPDPVRDELIEQLLAHRKELALDLADRRASEAGHLSKGGRRDFSG